MAHGTSKLDSTIPLRTAGPNGLELETAWVLGAPSSLRSNLHAGAQAGSWRDPAVSKSATTEALRPLEESPFAFAEAAETVFSFAAVLAEALTELADAGRPHPAVPPSRDPSLGVALLSAREREVLALVAEGRKNKAIADILYVSPNTIKTHVASLLTKLQADSRV